MPPCLPRIVLPQAEEDRRWVNAHKAFVARQQEVMKDVSSGGGGAMAGCCYSLWPAVASACVALAAPCGGAG